MKTVSHGKSIVSFDGTSIYYEIDATHKNKFLIFLHGLGGDLTAWNSERENLRKLGFPSIAVDLRGHGMSDRPHEESAYEFSNFARDIHLLIQKECSQKPVVIGHCFGGMVALTLEKIYPGTCRSLVLVDTSYKPPSFTNILSHHPQIKNLLKRLARAMPSMDLGHHADFSKFIGTQDLDARRILSDILHTSLRTYLFISEQLVHYNASSFLKNINIPTLIIEGEQDIIYPPPIARELNQKIKRSYLQLISHANHIIVINNPEEVTSAIYRFLKKIHF